MTEFKTEMCFVDIETTGLDANEDVPLELGIVLCDRYGNLAAQWKTLVWEEGIPDFMHGVDRGKANEFVNEMHTKSKLWSDLETFDTRTRDEADQAAVSFLKNRDVEPRVLPMCGSSIGSLDRPFTLRHFPKLNSYLSYRNIDISSVKELCKLNNPGLWEQIDKLIGHKEDAAHRVIEDCFGSINEYLWYREEFLLVEDED